MWVRKAFPSHRRPADGDLARWLRDRVTALAVPRHALAEERSNRRIGELLAIELASYGLSVELQGVSRNVVAVPAGGAPSTWVAAHYDSVPDTPGADDNASAVAVLLAAARSCPPGVGFVAFNREEDGMIGSSEFAAAWDGPPLRAVHVLEMVGYTDPRPGAQRVPEGVPRWLLPRDQGDFLAVVGIGAGACLAGQVRQTAGGTLGVPPVVTLQTPAAALRWIPTLGFSDHLPFVERGVPAVMWTDTAFYRTPHYHQRTDTPDTLDYAFMAEVATLLDACLRSGASSRSPSP